MPEQEKNPVIIKKHEAHLNREEKQKRILLTGLIVTLVLIFGLIGYGILDQTVLKGFKPIATVGDTQISTSYFQKVVWFERNILYQRHKELVVQYNQNIDNQFWTYFISNQLQNYEQQLAPSYADKLAQDTLNQLVSDVLIKQEAQKRNIIVTDEEINKYIQTNLFGFYAEGTPTSSPSMTPFSTSTRSALQLTLIPYTSTPTVSATNTGVPPTVTATASPTAALAANITPSPTATEIPLPTSTPFTMDAYNKLIGQYISDGYKYGLSMDDIKSFMSSFIYREKLTEALSINVKPQQEQVWARHILVLDEGTANKILTRLQKGEDFSSIAKELSLDTGSKENGGDVGWFSRGSMVKAFEDTAFSLKVGETSTPVQTDYGYHIIQVIGHENRNLTEAEIEKLKTQELNSWLTDQFSKVKVTYADNLTDLFPKEPVLKLDEYIFPTSTPSAY